MRARRDDFVQGMHAAHSGSPPAFNPSGVVNCKYLILFIFLIPSNSRSVNIPEPVAACRHYIACDRLWHTVHAKKGPLMKTPISILIAIALAALHAPVLAQKYPEK